MAIIINKDRGVNESETLGKRASNGIGPGTLRVIGYGNSKSITAGGLVAAYVPVPFSVALNGLAGPCTLSLTGPLECCGGNLGAQIGPVDHILGAEHHPVFHVEVTVAAVLIMISEQIDLVTIYKRRGVRSKYRADNRVLCEQLSRQSSGQG